MKFSAIIAGFAIIASATNAFVTMSPSRQSRAVLLQVANGSYDSPELKSAIDKVREAASAFSDETAHFANVWIEKMISGEQEEMPSGLLEECLIDDGAEGCQNFEKALKELDSLLGVGASEQY